jgi:PAS domain-containing protein
MSLRYAYNTWISPQRWLERAGIGAPARIVVGLVMLTMCVLLTARAIRLIPNEDESTIHRRTALVEMVATQTAAGIMNDNRDALLALLNLTAQRHREVLSGGVRREGGTLVISTADHDRHWASAHRNVNSATHMRVPLLQSRRLWGQLEMSFAPLRTRSSWGDWWSSSTVQLFVFTLAAVFLLSWAYMARMLTLLDPSSAIPARLQLLMDTLVEGMVILDEEGLIVMANQSFANSAFTSVDRLIGRELSSLPWLAHDVDAAPESVPWRAVAEVELQQRSVPLRLQIGVREARQLNINASPILGSDGVCRGVVVTFADQTAIEADNARLAHILNRLGDVVGTSGSGRPALSDEALASLKALAREAEALSSMCQQNAVANQPEAAPQHNPSPIHSNVMRTADNS